MMTKTNFSIEFNNQTGNILKISKNISQIDKEYQYKCEKSPSKTWNLHWPAWKIPVVANSNEWSLNPYILGTTLCIKEIII